MGLIVFIIALSACISLSIREASDTAKEEALKDLKVTAQISPDREAMMQNLENMEDKKSALEGASGLTLEELETYAEAESVSGFYYTVSSSLNGESL